MSTDRLVEAVGAKCAQLLRLRSVPALADIIPPLVPVPRAFVADAAKSASIAGEPTHERLAAALERRVADLTQRLLLTCGPPPWIVRSSGEEDDPDLPRAGAYSSLTCEDADQLACVMAAVVLSGRRKVAGATPAADTLRPIPVFIQPLVGRRARPADDGLTPLLSAALLAELRPWLMNVHQQLSGGLACEWLLDGDTLVSVSTNTVMVGSAVVGSLTAGFGHFTAQRGDGGTSRAVWLDGTDLVAHAGGLLRLVERGAWRLVQARPAHYIATSTRVETLSAADCEQLARLRFVEHRVAVVVTPRHVRVGAVLTRRSIDEAWDAYLDLTPHERSRVAAASVQVGTLEQHAGLNFLAADVAVVSGMPEAGPDDQVVVDASRDTCFVSTGDVGSVAFAPSVAQVVRLPDDPFVLSAQWFDPELDPRSLFQEIAASQDGTVDGSPLAMRLADALLQAGCPFKRQAEVVRNSLLPRPHTRLLHPTLGWISPSAYGFAVARGGHSVREFACAVPVSRPDDRYVREYMDARQPLDAPLGALSTRAREAWAQAALDLGARHRQRLLQSAVAVAGSHDHALIELARNFDDRILALALYTPVEREQLWSAWLDRVERLDAETLALIVQLRFDDQTPALSVQWLEWAATRPEEAAHVSSCVSRMDRAIDRIDAGRALADVLETFHTLQRLCEEGAAPDWVIDGVIPRVVDAFDRSGKKLLRDAVEHARQVDARLVDLLRGWIDWLRLFAVSPRLLEACERWLATHEPAAGVAEVLMIGRPWHAWVADAETTGRVDLPGLHQLLNVLHQVSLRLPRAASEQPLPVRAASLVEMANGFGREASSVLRQEARVLEIDRPMGLHKASFRCVPGAIEIEFAEPPDVTEHDLGRLAAFEGILAKFNTWFDRATFQTHRHLDAGVWVLSIRATLDTRHDASDAREWAVAALLTLFDMAYDCSGLPTPEGNLRHRLAAPGWAEIFGSLIEYRRAFRDRPGRTASRADPLTLFLLSLLVSDEHEHWIADSWVRPTPDLLETLHAVTFCGELHTVTDWQALLRQRHALALLLSARDPAALLAWLAEVPLASRHLFPVARAVLGCQTVRPAIDRLLAQGPDGPAPFHELCAAVRPDLLPGRAGCPWQVS